MNKTSPIYLLADSQLLFWKDNGELFLRSLLNFIDDPEPSAAYIGASNGDQPAFFDIFVAAMEAIGIHRCHKIRAAFPDEDKRQLEAASIILLAGGDVKQGWERFVETGIKEVVEKRYAEGAVLIGVSAGAVQLGTCALHTGDGGEPCLLNTFQILPFIIDAHAEQTDWADLKRTMSLRDGFEQGIGIPAGGGAVYHPDHTLEPVRHNLTELTRKDSQLISGLLCPKSKQEKLPLH